MAGEGLFFTGVVLKNNRDLLKEQEARERLAMDKERLAMEKEELAARRKEARKKNYKGLYEDFGESNAGELDFWIKNNVEDHINWVGDNHENEDQGAFHGTKAKQSNNIRSGQDVLSDIWSDYSSKMKVLEAGGDSVDKANYVQGEDGVYEFQRRMTDLKTKLRNEEITPQEFADAYYDNTDNSLIKLREKGDIGKSLVDGYKGPKETYLYTNEKGDKDFYGWSNDAKNAVYTEYMNTLEQDDDGSFINQEGRDEYFNSTLVDENQDEETNAMVLFFRDKNNGLSPSEKELSRLNPIENQFDNYDNKLATEYKQWLSKKKTDPHMVNAGYKTKTQSKQENPLKNAHELPKWEEMTSSQNFTENKYGSHGRMLLDYNFTQNVGGKHSLTAPTFNNMQISDDSNLTSEMAKKYILEQLELGGGQIESKLSQVSIAEDHANMYGIYSIPVSNAATGGKGAMVLEVSVPAKNFDSKLLGPVPLRWYNSLGAAREGLYDDESSSGGAYDDI